MLRIRDFTEVVAWSVLAYLLASNSTFFIMFALGATYGDPGAAPPSVVQSLIYVSPVFPLILGVLAVVRLKLGGDNVGARIGMSSKTLPGDALLGAVAGIISIGLAVLSLKVAAHFVDVPPIHLLPKPVHLYFMTVGALVPGICEELYFRGMLMRVGNRLPRWALIFLTAVAFSVWHVGTPAYLPHTFLLGLLLGTLTSVVGRLAPAIIAHTLANVGIGLLFLSGFYLGQ